MLIILFSSRVNENNTVLAFCQHPSFPALTSFLFLSGDSMPSGIVCAGEIGGSKGPVLQLIKEEIQQVAGRLSQE